MLQMLFNNTLFVTKGLCIANLITNNIVLERAMRAGDITSYDSNLNELYKLSRTYSGYEVIQ